MAAKRYRCSVTTRRTAYLTETSVNWGRPESLARLFVDFLDMTFQPNTAGAHEREIIDALLTRQEEVLGSLDELNAQIEAQVELLRAERKAEAEAQNGTAADETILPFENHVEAAPREKAA